MSRFPIQHRPKNELEPGGPRQPLVVPSVVAITIVLAVTGAPWWAILGFIGLWMGWPIVPWLMDHWHGPPGG